MQDGPELVLDQASTILDEMFKAWMTVKHFAVGQTGVAGWVKNSGEIRISGLFSIAIASHLWVR